jgi:hypothetical protein
LIQYKTREGTVYDLVVNRPRYQRWGIYYALIMAILLIGAYTNLEFIYFQF